MKRTTGHLSEKNGRWYGVINLYDADGRRCEKWQSLDLAAKKGSKTEANHRLNQILERYNSGDLYLHETMTNLMWWRPPGSPTVRKVPTPSRNL